MVFNSKYMYDVIPFGFVTCIEKSLDVEIFWVQSLLVYVPNCSELCIPSIFKLTSVFLGQVHSFFHSPPPRWVSNLKAQS